MKTSTRAVLRRVVELACRAPSVHNSQPWLWRVADKRTLELYADPTRQLPVADPEGRNLLISCGAALQHAQEAAKALGLTSTVELATPAPGHHLLARIEFAAGRPPADARGATARARPALHGSTTLHLVAGARLAVDQARRGSCGVGGLRHPCH